jgi:hypothetical protein
VEGTVFQVDEFSVFLFRAKESPVYESTTAFKIRNGDLKKIEGKWTHTDSGATFDSNSRTWIGEIDGLDPLIGFDTFWYTWSPFHPEAVILK